jgi:hypothetical protein
MTLFNKYTLAAIPRDTTGGGAGGGGGADDKGGNGGGGGGGGGDPWYQPYAGELDKDTLGWLDGKRFPKIQDALKSGAAAERLARDRNAISRPADMGKVLEWEGFKELGWNDNEGDYLKGLTPPKMPNGQQHNAELLDVFGKAAHKLRLLPAQATPLYQALTDHINKIGEDFAAKGAREAQELEASLRKEWGLDYDKRGTEAKRAAASSGIPVDALSKMESALGTGLFMKVWDSIGKLTGEAKLITGEGGSGGDMTPAQAAAERRRLEGDPAWMKVFTDPHNPQRQDYAARRQKLIEIEAQGSRR